MRTGTRGTAAPKINIDYKIGGYLVSEKVKFEWKESDYHD